jgi:hypothetical protein
MDTEKLRDMTEVEKDACLQLQDRRKNANQRYAVAKTIMEAAESEMDSIATGLSGLSAVMHGAYDESFGIDLDGYFLYQVVDMAQHIQEMVDETGGEDV